MGQDYDEVPTIDCIFLTILHHVALRRKNNDVIIYTNGDLVFPSSELLAVLSFVYCRPDDDSEKDAILVGQRRDTPLMDGEDHDTDGNKLFEGGFLTVDNFQHFFSQALTTSVLHADFGVDYFILPAPVLSSLILTRGFPPFLVGRYRWDNALLASFILDEIAASSSKRDSSVGIRTIDVTSVLPVVHLGQHSASPDYFQAQLGAKYNNRVAREYLGDLYMLGRIHNTGWILSEAFPVLQAREIPSPVYKMVLRTNKVDADVLQAFDRAYYHQHRPSLAPYDVNSRGRDSDCGLLSGLCYPTLLLLTVLPRDVPYAKLWMPLRHSQNTTSIAAGAETRDHFLFVTVDQDSYNELDAAFPGTVILEKAFGWPSSAVKWRSFSRLLRHRLTVGIMSVQDVVGLPSLWQQTLSGKCEVVLIHRPIQKSEDEPDRGEWDVFSIRPSAAGMFFWEEYQKGGQGNGEERTGLQSLFAPTRPKKADYENVCVVALHAMRHV